MSKTFRNLAFSVLAGFALLASGAAQAAAETPFTAMAGSWSGSGTVTLKNGVKEQIRCRANNNVDGSGANLVLALRCASDSYKFDLQGNVNHNAGAVSGTWAEMTHRVGGTITGSASANRVSVRVEGTIAAMLAVTTKGNQQQISIESPGSEMAAVAISMNRSVSAAR
jgi:hypothetical protein